VNIKRSLFISADGTASLKLMYVISFCVMSLSTFIGWVISQLVFDGTVSDISHGFVHATFLYLLIGLVPTAIMMNIIGYFVSEKTDA